MFWWSGVRTLKNGGPLRREPRRVRPCSCWNWSCSMDKFGWHLQGFKLCFSWSTNRSLTQVFCSLRNSLQEWFEKSTSYFLKIRMLAIYLLSVCLQSLCYADSWNEITRSQACSSQATLTSERILLNGGSLDTWLRQSSGCKAGIFWKCDQLWNVTDPIQEAIYKL